VAPPTPRSPIGTAAVLRPDERHLPAVVLCNGIACDDVYWRDVWAADRRAHHGGALALPRPRAQRRAGGAATRSARTRWSDDLRAVMGAAGIGRAVLVGHSYGVQIAAEAHRCCPELVAGLVMVAGAAGRPLGTIAGLDPGGAVLGLLDHAARRAPRVGGALVTLGARSPVGYWGGRLIGGIGPDAPRDAMRDYFRHVSGLDVRTLLRMFRRMQAHSATHALAHVDVPTTVVLGLDDRMTPPARARRIAAAVGHARLVEVPGATHVLPIERPEVVVDEVLAVARAAATPGAGSGEVAT
jgi:pimeloyl-ACP methyl ester carboxylesterase